MEADFQTMRFEKSISQLLLPGTYETRGDVDVMVTGIAYSSRDVVPGDVFFCIPGTTSDGHRYAPDAVERGAVALVCEHELDLDIPQFIVGDARSELALAAARAYDNPSDKLEVVGVTGTNGKTTTTFLVDWVLRDSRHVTGLIGTVETSIAGRRLHSEHTTPESSDLQQLFAEMVDAGVSHVVMEVSSHAIDLGRALGTRFAVAAFSQLTQDHLDYHKTMEAYYAAKRRLFMEYEVGRSAVCIDDGYGRRLAGELRDAGRDLLTCGFADDADVRATDVVYGPRGTSFTLVTADESVHVEMPLVGSYNVDNALLASTICICLGIPLPQVATSLASSPQVPGRLERVHADNEPRFNVFVDYAHTPDAVDKATHVVSEITEGRTIVVFGCGGDRDRTKRPKMGRAALDAGDYCIVTSDNPRTEDPDAIIEDILTGMGDDDGRFEVIADRHAAIARAVELAGPGDSVLIAGKGHEDYQLVGDRVLSFDDRLVAKQEMESCNADDAR